MERAAVANTVRRWWRHVVWRTRAGRRYRILRRSLWLCRLMLHRWIYLNVLWPNTCRDCGGSGYIGYYDAEYGWQADNCGCAREGQCPRCGIQNLRWQPEIAPVDDFERCQFCAYSMVSYGPLGAPGGSNERYERTLRQQHWMLA